MTTERAQLLNGVVLTALLALFVGALGVLALAWPLERLSGPLLLGLLGAYVLGFLEILLAGSLPSGFTAYRDAIIFALLIVVLLVRPQGILGSGETERV